TGEHLGERISEESLIVQHRPSTQILRGDRVTYQPGPCITHQLAGLHMGDIRHAGITGYHPAFADAGKPEDDDSICHQTANPNAMRARTGPNLASVSLLIDWGGAPLNTPMRLRSSILIAGSMWPTSRKSMTLTGRCAVTLKP